MPDPSLGPLAKCPVCGRTGLVGKEREIAGTRAVTVYKCHGCDNSWRVRDDDPLSFDLPPREPAVPAPARLRPSETAAGGATLAAAAVSRTPRLVILSVGRAEAYQPHGAEICISITDPKAKPVRLSRKFKAVLRLAFSDIASPSSLPIDVLFTPQHAQKILDFVDRWSDVERIVIHCVAGLSRSPAVGMALCDLRRWPLERMEGDYPLWNTWVRSELVRIGTERHAASAREVKRRRAAKARLRGPRSRPASGD